MTEICRKFSRYARKEFHLMTNRPRKLLIPVTGQFHFMTQLLRLHLHLSLLLAWWLSIKASQTSSLSPERGAQSYTNSPPFTW